MAKSVAIALAMISVALLVAPQMVRSTEERLFNDNNTKTLTVYYQDIFKGPSANLIPVAGGSMNTFGTVFVGNPTAREGISLDSPEISTGEGIKVISSRNGNQYLSFSLIFNSGSTMEFQGVVGDEISLVGGTKEFRGVRGYASFELVSKDPATNSAIAKLVIDYKHQD